MLTLRRRSSREDVSLLSSGGRPVILATLDVPFSEEATAFAIDAAVENGQPLILLNVAEVLPTAYTLLGYGYVEREELQEALRKPAELARSLVVTVERLRRDRAVEARPRPRRRARTGVRRKADRDERRPGAGVRGAGHGSDRPGRPAVGAPRRAGARPCSSGAQRARRRARTRRRRACG